MRLMMLLQLKTERLGVHWKGTKGVNWLFVLLEMLFSGRASNTRQPLRVIPGKVNLTDTLMFACVCRVSVDYQFYVYT